MSGFVGGLVGKLTGDKKDEQQGNQPPPPGTVTDSGNSGVLGAVSGALSSAADKVTDVVPDSVKEFAEEKKKMVEDFKRQQEELIKGMIVSKIESIYNLATNTIGNVIKEKIKDPYMPGFVQDLVDELVDTFWPDVTGEARERIISGLAPKIMIDHGKKPCPCGGHIIAFFRYWLHPYDRSFWRQLRNPLYWLFTLASLVPVYGIGLITYMLYFLIQDCKDSYSMQKYIVDFKALQFISLGALSAIIGSVQYYICLSQSPMTCDDFAPKVEAWILLVFVVQIFFVWAAFCFLRGAERKGGYKFQYDQATRRKMEEQSSNANSVLNAITSSDDAHDHNFSQKLFVDLQGESEEVLQEKSISRLTKFLIWDIVVFILCIIFTCLIFWYNALDRDSEPDFSDKNSWDSKKNWKLSMSLFWVKAFYGLMSFPFALLKLPVINTVISHAKPTGFNWWGNIVPYKGVEEPLEDQPWEPEYNGTTSYA